MQVIMREFQSIYSEMWLGEQFIVTGALEEGRWVLATFNKQVEPKSEWVGEVIE